MPPAPPLYTHCNESLPPCPPLPSPPAAVSRRGELLSSIDLASAQCSQADDREMVMEEVDRLYGGVAAMEAG